MLVGVFVDELAGVLVGVMVGELVGVLVIVRVKVNVGVGDKAVEMVWTPVLFTAAAGTPPET